MLLHIAVIQIAANVCYVSLQTNTALGADHPDVS